MNKDWEKIDQLFNQALECPNEAREEFLARAAEHDPALGGKLQALLDAHEENQSFMESPVMRVSLSPQFDRWQSQIMEAMVPAPGAQMTGQMIGRLLDWKYRLEELCGRGGMGAVYRATHVGTGRRVAVKVIAPELAGNHEFIERFRREAKTIGRLRHPNIVNVTDFGITGENEQTMAYLVMEHLEGVTLATKLKDKRPLPLADALDILSQTCEAIDEAHRLGILHRDLKPENIWLEPVGIGGCNVKVLDFGIAQLHDLLAIEEPEPLPVVSETSETTGPQPQIFSITEAETLRMNLTLQQLTRAGTVMGSPKYMSPEQCRGEKLDSASDIYSLGVIAYQMLSGETPFRGTVAELLQQHREATPAPLSRKRGDIPATLDAVVCQALAKEPSARPATAGAFAFLLSLQLKGNDWLRQQADAINRRHRLKLTGLAVRLQWPSWLLIGLTLMATVKLPGLRPLQAGLVFGFLWLLIAAITLWKQNSVTAACALFLEQTRKTAKSDVDTGAIVKAIRRRSVALARATWAEWAGIARKLCSFKLDEIRRWANSLLIAPPLLQEGLRVDEAAQRSAKLIEPLRRKLVYPFFRRLLAFALVLTTWQVMLVIWGVTLDGGRSGLTGAIIFLLPQMLALCFITFSLSLKSSIEQSVLYLTSRQALGEVTTEETGPPFRQDMEAERNSSWLSFKTYAPACALLLLAGYLQFQKFPLMSVVINQGNLYTVKALQATGVPLPFWSLESDPPRAFRRWLRRAALPYGRNSFEPKPYGLHILRSYAMTKFLIEKGLDVNTRFVLDRTWTPPGAGDVVVTPLHAALADKHVEAARLLIAHGADVHALDSIGRTPLTVAITYCPSAIELLLASGVDINEQTRFGAPLLTAARYQWLYRGTSRAPARENAVKILLEKGADPNTRDSDGRNALMVMSMEPRSIGVRLGVRHRWRSIPPPPRPGLIGSPGVTRRRPVDPLNINVETEPDRDLLLIGDALIQTRCDVNAADSNGRTPLMYAARYHRGAAVRALLEAGADVNARDKGGMTALDLANQFANQEIIRLLQRAGALPGAPKKPGGGPVKPAE
jgi:serine/threonine protein kinase/ankyrin repeat protein